MEKEEIKLNYGCFAIKKKFELIIHDNYFEYN